MGNQTSHSDDLWFEIEKVINILKKDATKEKVLKTIRLLEQVKTRISNREGHTSDSWAELLKDSYALVRDALADPEIAAILA